MDGAPGEIIGERPVSSFNHPAGRPIITLHVGVLRRPVESAQYTSTDLTNHLALQEISASIGSVGDAYDNALIESANGLYKTECINTTIFHAGPYKTFADVEYATAEWVDWYNCERLHSSIGLVPPNEFELSHYAALDRELQPV